MDFTAVLIASIVILTILTIYMSVRKDSKLPPGPIGLPLVGYLPFLDSEKPHETISHLVEEFGKIVHLQLGQLPCVVLADEKLIKSILSRCEYFIYVFDSMSRLKVVHSIFFFFNSALLMAMLQPQTLNWIVYCICCQGTHVEHLIQFGISIQI